jgi:hypothetical protein
VVLLTLVVLGLGLAGRLGRGGRGLAAAGGDQEERGEDGTHAARFATPAAGLSNAPWTCW